MAQPRNKAAGQGGLAQAAPGSGQMILYATSANRTAVDRLNHNDNDPNSLFTRVLLQEIGKPGISVAQMAKTVQGRVRDLATRAQRVQIPAILRPDAGDFYLMSMGPLSQAQAVSAPAPVASPNFGMTVGSHYLAFPGGPALTLLPQGSYLVWQPL